MDRTWQVQDAKARFSAFLEASLRDGPQIVTRRGVAAAVLVPIDEWRRLQRTAKPGLKALLLAPGTVTETLTPPRASHRHRAAPTLD